MFARRSAKRTDAISFLRTDFLPVQTDAWLLAKMSNFDTPIAALQRPVLDDAFSLSACHLTGCQRPPKTMTGGANDPGMREGDIPLRLLAGPRGLPPSARSLCPQTEHALVGAPQCVWSMLMMSITTREVPLVSCGMLSTPLHMVVRKASSTHLQGIAILQ